MKRLTCEICDSTELLKQDGVFVCQTCGTKYTVEEARKMMVEETVESQDPGHVQNTPQVESLLKLAHSSFDSKNYSQAENFCNQVIVIDDKNYDAWKLKGEAINYQISANNPRILEAYNCIMTSYRVLDDEGKEKNKLDILSSIKTCIEGEIDFWLDQMEAQRPSKSAVNKVKSTFDDSISKIVSAFSEMGFDTGEKYKTNLTNNFINKVNVKCFSTWKTTVGYNYYRDTLNINNSHIGSICWRDDYRPNNEIFTTFIEECDNLIDLLSFSASLFNSETKKQDIINTYENIIFFNSHAIRACSFKRMVSTTTNGYGAVLNRNEYWETDKVLTEHAINIRQRNNEKYRKLLQPLDTKYKKEELKKRISALNTQIDDIQTKRKIAPFALLGIVLLVPAGIVMLITGFCFIGSLGAQGAATAGIFMGIVELAISGLLSMWKTPSQEVIQENIKKQQLLINERNALQKELDSLT